MTEAKLVDEYGILHILKRHNAESALSEIEAVLDAFCNQYMSDHAEIRKSAFVEMVCHLKVAVIESKGDNSVLSTKIKKLIIQLDEDIDQK
ncbi:hypothetical protein J8Z28_07720 [Pseudoalteromonas sp. SCSIO 43088]|uniref:hypothetical protein n=1 Tax=Pseudoalteromonas sp. SCSIO 43088 TaxID=2822846 RepID=UPI00202B5356|nr:hypothetical protein [Pseudoalteromonas sp. SCSIO 43088]URQ87719.1 hypothetical protein J8Z28_07720 [Pseudoalteromonas sp. SCSIO 43088]